MPRIYEMKDKSFAELKGNVSVPKYQRNFVWKPNQRKQLIKSLKSGLPIGSFMLQELAPNSGRFNIIDGRQRFSTLLDYESNRHLYVSDDDIKREDVVQNILGKSSFIMDKRRTLPRTDWNTAVEEIRACILTELKVVAETRDSMLFRVSRKIFEVFQGASDKDEERIYNAVGVFLDAVIDPIHLESLDLPCIVFFASVNKKYIQDAFININKHGTKLTKYDIYAADWLDMSMVVNDDRIIEKVISRYIDNLEENQNIGVTGFNEVELRENKEINPYEYGYALSLVIGDNCSGIYNARNSIEVDPLGFNILAGIFNLRISDMPYLAEKLIESHLNLHDLTDKIIDCVKEVEDILEPFCTTRTTTEHRSFYDHAFNQLVSYIVTVFKTKYVIENGEIKANAVDIRYLSDLKHNLPYWYLYDNIREYWSGTGDKKLNGCVVLKNGELISRKSDYFTAVDKDTFVSALKTWIEKKNKDSNNVVKSDSKLFINYLLVKKNPHINFGRSVDVEHIVTQQKLEDLSTREHNATIYGISSPANLTLLPSVDNREKQRETYYEYVDRKMREDTAFRQELNLEILSNLLYPSRDAIRFVETRFSSRQFYDFLANRSNQLIDEFINLYYPD